ncbi:LysM peptidoglycan-binding domain-containing protein [Enterococcus hirae]|uniref:LysM peptidoglycan-binding domain-containing protein n=1 Tax=Enterococcus hirae TaxID=1354 RepID=UPI0027C9B241|nr:LysM peptidoglycan-binding domain-containing protein [Enterococcus hirae]MDQ2183222.1 LysM peptidoglycan-binding domain-containing protein [Enterococcus hirae]
MKLLRVLAIGATIGGVALATTHEKVVAAEWTPRTVEQIKADMKGNEYTIVWGDTLSGISQATNISVQKLADMNKIANVDLIYAGNKLVFDGNVATVQNNKGETVAQSVIQRQDKVDSTKPVGQPVQNTTNSNNSATQNTTTPSTDNTVTGNTQTGGQTTGNTGTTTPSTPENNGGTTQTPIQPDNNQTGSTGNTTTPSQPNTGGNQNNSGNSNGGTTTPSQPSKPEIDGNQGGTGSTGGTTTPSKPQAPTIVSGYIGNSGKVFDTPEEANKFADEKAANDLSIKGYKLITIDYSDGSEKFSIDFY